MRALKIMAMLIAGFFYIISLIGGALFAIWLPFGTLVYCTDVMGWHAGIGLTAFFIICWTYVFVADRFGYLDDLGTEVGR